MSELRYDCRSTLTAAALIILPSSSAQLLSVSPHLTSTDPTRVCGATNLQTFLPRGRIRHLKQGRALKLLPKRMSTIFMAVSVCPLQYHAALLK